MNLNRLCSFNFDTRDACGNKYGQNWAWSQGIIRNTEDIPGVPPRPSLGTARCPFCFVDDNEAIEFNQYSWILPSGSSEGVKAGINGNSAQFGKMVADRAFAIGCATSYCAGGRYYLVCNYYPFGSILGNPWYVSGPTASQCPNGSDDGLCLGPHPQIEELSQLSDGCRENEVYTESPEVFGREKCHLEYTSTTITSTTVECPNGKSKVFYEEVESVVDDGGQGCSC